MAQHPGADGVQDRVTEFGVMAVNCGSPGGPGRCAAGSPAGLDVGGLVEAVVTVGVGPGSGVGVAPGLNVADIGPAAAAAGLAVGAQTAAVAARSVAASSTRGRTVDII